MWMRLEELLLYFEHCSNSRRIGGLRLFDRSKKARPITDKSRSCEFLSLPTGFTTSPRLAHTGYPLPKTFPHLLKSHYRQHAFWVCGCPQDGSIPRLFTSLRHLVFKAKTTFIQHCLRFRLTLSHYPPHRRRYRTWGWSRSTAHNLRAESYWRPSRWIPCTSFWGTLGRTSHWTPLQDRPSFISALVESPTPRMILTYLAIGSDHSTSPD